MMSAYVTACFQAAQWQRKLLINPCLAADNPFQKAWFTKYSFGPFRCFLAQLSHWLKVSYCDRWMSVVRRLQLLQMTSPPKLLSGF